jgi:multidrug efflux pump subunit AcrA (membrane-fusion protein)
MQATLFVLSVVLAINGPSPLTQAAPSGPAASGPVLNHCLVSLIEEVQVPAREAGQLEALEAKEGLQVKAGTTLGHIDDKEPTVQRKIKQAEHDAAKEKSDDDINVRYARAATDVAYVEYQKALEANTKVKGSIPEVEVNRLKLTWIKSKLQIEQARLEQRVNGFTADGKGAEVEAAETSIERRQLKTPIDGVVTNVYRHVGEWCAPGDPVVKIVRVDRLRIEGFLNAADFDPPEIEGRAVTVDIELAHGRHVKFTGKVVFVSPLVGAGGEYRVFAEVANRQEAGQWVLRPGLFATMTIHLK